MSMSWYAHPTKPPGASGGGAESAAIPDTYRQRWEPKHRTLTMR